MLTKTTDHKGDAEPQTIMNHLPCMCGREHKKEDDENNGGWYRRHIAPKIKVAFVWEELSSTNKTSVHVYGWKGAK